MRAVDEIDGFTLDGPAPGREVLRVYRGTRVGAGGGPAEVRVWVSPAPGGEERLDGTRESLQRAEALGDGGPATVLGFGLTVDGCLWVASPADAVTDLPTLLERAGPLDVELTARLGMDLAEGLARAHALEPPLVHGTLHPRSVLVDTQGRAHVWGHVLFREAMLYADDATGVLQHVASYLSPEQVTQGSETLSPPMDVFALASLLYLAVTGRPAFAGDTPLATTLKVSMARPPDTSALRDRSAPLAELLHRMWSKDPSARPRASDVAGSLSALAGREGEIRRRLAAHGFDAPADPEAAAPRPSPAGEFPRYGEIDPDPTDLQVQLPNHLPDEVPIPMARGDTLEVDRPGPPAQERTLELGRPLEDDQLLEPTEELAPQVVQLAARSGVGFDAVRRTADMPQQRTTIPDLDPTPAPPARSMEKTGPSWLVWAAVAVAMLSTLLATVGLVIWLAS